MRISEKEKKIIIEAVKKLDPNAKIWLFGSRTDDKKKGGDIDIAILSDYIDENKMHKIEIKRLILDGIGEQKLDIITSKTGKEAIFELAIAEGIQLYESAIR